MKRSSRMQRIVRLSSVEERRAAQALNRAESELGQLDTQRRDLLQYQADYLRRLTAGGPEAVPGYEAQKVRVFVQRIELAIAGIDYKITLATKRVERERRQWQQQQRRVKVVGEIATRARGDETNAVESSLQREIDDRARRRS